MDANEKRHLAKVLNDIAVVVDDMVGLTDHADFLIGEAHSALKLPRRGTDGSRKLLVVDDDKLVLRSLRRALGGQFDVVTASAVDEAIDLVRRHKFAAMVVDFNLREGTGIDVLRVALKSQPEALRILHTGDPSPRVLRYKRGHLVQHFLTKPADLGQLRELLGATR